MAVQRPLVQGATGPDMLPTGDVLSVVTAFTGEFKLVAFTATPSGWLDCNGAEVSRTTYAGLFALLGETFGPGDSSTTFNLPDFRDKFPMGAGDTYSVGGVGGSNSVGIAEVNIPGHTHLVGVRVASGGTNDDEPAPDKIFGPATIYSNVGGYDTDLSPFPTSVWGGDSEEHMAAPIDTLNRYLAVRYIICWNGLTP